MDKTVTAEFESIDQATFAAKNVTDHFEGIKQVKVSYQKSKPDREPLFSSFVIPYGPFGGTGTPMGMGMNAGMNSGLLPVAVNLSEDESERRRSLDHRHAKVSITAPEKLVQQIESTLHTGGGLSVRES